MDGIIYLKLGGSLITDKREAETPRLDVVARLAKEIADALQENPTLRLVLGHGSGSFGHVVGARYGTRHGVHSAEGWYGFAATHDAAARLNRLVTQALLQAGIPAWSIQPSATLRCLEGKIVEGPIQPVKRALAVGVIPLVYGDVALDDVRGGTIVSTEELFDWLAQQLPPSRIILVGEVDGVYNADPQSDPTAKQIAEITTKSYQTVIRGLGGSHGVDVTGGMAAKVQQSLELVQRIAGLEITICSGLLPGNVRSALRNREPRIGTVVRA